MTDAEAPEKVINLNFYGPCVITAEEYDAIFNDLRARQVLDLGQPGDRILARVLSDSQGRRLEIQEWRSAQHQERQ